MFGSHKKLYCQTSMTVVFDSAASRLAVKTPILQCILIARFPLNLDECYTCSKRGSKIVTTVLFSRP